MTSSSRSSFAAILLLFLSCISSCLSTLAQHDVDSHINTICKPFGLCEPCPEDAMNQPFCKPFGNRRVVHCSNVTSGNPGSSQHNVEGSPSQTSPSPETIAWVSCGRIVLRERADFWEFVGCNVLFAAVAITIVVVRTRRGNMQRARALAARIGIGASTAYPRGRPH